jgi:hypothetical protein
VNFYEEKFWLPEPMHMSVVSEIDLDDEDGADEGSKRSTSIGLTCSFCDMAN